MADGGDYAPTPAPPDLGHGEHSVVVGVLPDGGEQFVGVDGDTTDLPVLTAGQKG